MANRYKISKAWTQDVQEVIHGRLSFGDNSSYSGSATGTTNWERTRQLISESVSAGQVFTNPVVSTYSLVYTAATAYQGGVLAPNGDIHFVPLSANRGQKISPAGVVSTYSLVYTTTSAYSGGVLAPNGDIHFVPVNANRGQKISPTGVVSTYSLAYTVATAYQGGVLAPNGDIHFVPRAANRGQKISPDSVVSTYSLVYTTTIAYIGGVLAPNGDIHFVPTSAAVGQILVTGAAKPFGIGLCSSAFLNKF